MRGEPTAGAHRTVPTAAEAPSHPLPSEPPSPVDCVRVSLFGVRYYRRRSGRVRFRGAFPGHQNCWHATPVVRNVIVAPEVATSFPGITTERLGAESAEPV